MEYTVQERCRAVLRRPKMWPAISHYRGTFVRADQIAIGDCDKITGPGLRRRFGNCEVALSKPIRPSPTRRTITLMNSEFTRKHLQELIEIGGRALEKEDRMIREAVLARPNLQRPFRPGKARFGIRRQDNERYFQFVIWRALLKSFEFCVDIERENNNDFVVWLPNDQGNTIVSVGEMKRWVSPSGRLELPRIREDVRKLRRTGGPGFVLLTTAYAATSSKSQIDFLSHELDVPNDKFCSYKFPSLFETTDDWNEFALVGFLASDSLIPTYVDI